MNFTSQVVEEGSGGCIATRPNRLQWYAIQTRGQHEKRVARQLEYWGLKGFLPLTTEVRRWSDRRMVVDIPLYPCYTFVRAPVDSAIRASMLRIPGVLRLVGYPEHPLAIPDSEMEVIQRLVAHRVTVRPHAFLSEGTRVRICGGVLHGIEGILVRRNSDASLVISVQLIQRSVALRVDGYDVEPV